MVCMLNFIQKVLVENVVVSEQIVYVNMSSAALNRKELAYDSKQIPSFETEMFC
jgi:hypothetical protein